MQQDLLDRLHISALIQDWALWRDTGQWDRLATTWHPGGTMTATWFHGPFEQFIAAARAGSGRRSRSMHVLGGTIVELNGSRALAQTRMTIRVRTLLDGVEVDVSCHGRFFDRIERREPAGKDKSGWGIVARCVIYEMDRLDPVDPAARISLDPALLVRFPAGYRHLAYVQTRGGAQVNPALVTGEGEALATLLREAEVWLKLS